MNFLQSLSASNLHVISRTLTDPALKKLVQRIQQKIVIFDELRDAMRVACPDKIQGLNDKGDDDIKTIESRVSHFRHSPKIVLLTSKDTRYYKMVKQIDKYWDKLFADPIEVEAPTGKLMIQPLRFLKRDQRKKSGQHSLTKTLKGMLADTLG